MNVEFDKSFLKSISKIKDNTVLKRLEKIILQFESASSLESIPNCKKMVGYETYFRVKFGDYRVGFEKIDNSTIRFIIVDHRQNIYKKYP